MMMMMMMMMMDADDDNDVVMVMMMIVFLLFPFDDVSLAIIIQRKKTLPNGELIHNGEIGHSLAGR